MSLEIANLKQSTFDKAGLSKVAGCRRKSWPTWLVFFQLLCLAFLYRWRFLNKVPLDWPLTLTTQPSTSKLSDDPAEHYLGTIFRVFLISQRWWVEWLIGPLCFHPILLDDQAKFVSICMSSTIRVLVSTLDNFYIWQSSCMHKACTAKHHVWQNLVMYAFKKFWFWRNCPYVCPPLHVILGWNFASQAPALLVGKSHSRLDF